MRGENHVYNTSYRTNLLYVFCCLQNKKTYVDRRKEKEKGPEPVERPVYWCPRKNRPIGREQERITAPTKEITLEKDVASIYDLVASSVQMNLGEEKNVRTGQGSCKRSGVC